MYFTLVSNSSVQSQFPLAHCTKSSESFSFITNDGTNCTGQSRLTSNKAHRKGPHFLVVTSDNKNLKGKNEGTPHNNFLKQPNIFMSGAGPIYSSFSFP